MDSNCNTKVIVSYTRGGLEITRDCGKQYIGETVLCEKHKAEAMKRYPQGWAGYPGDTCKHGVYTGGCGADYMCGRCEDGE